MPSMINNLDGKEGDTEISLERITRVGIFDLTAVAEHRICRYHGSTSHFIRFNQGGCLRFAFTDAGEILELGGDAVSIMLDTTNATLVVGPYAL